MSFQENGEDRLMLTRSRYLKMAENMRKTGIDIIGDVQWGTHFCQFYQTREDLIDILVPYFKAGLENNEFCMWVTSEPLTIKEVENAMRSAVHDFPQYLKKGQIEIIPYTEWYLKGGVFSLQRVLNSWVDKLKQARNKSYEGMRITGNTAWLEKKDWRNFTDYEETIDSVIGKYQMIAICSYALDKCGAHEIIDVVRNHQFALIKREGELGLIESSKRKRTKDDLRKSEEKYRTLYETIKDGIVATDRDGRIFECNQAFADMLGYSKEDLTKLTYQQLTPDKWHQMEAKVVDEFVVSRGYSDEYEKEYIRKDGKVIPISIKVWLIRDEGGKPRGMWGVVRDITERKRLEEELRKLSNAVEQSPSTVVITDTKGNIEYVNPKFFKTTGYTPEEAIGQNPRILKSGEQKAEYYKCLWDTITSGKEWRGEFHNKKKTGELYWEYASISPIRNSGGIITHFLAIKEDITERKCMEAEINDIAKFPAENPYPVLRVNRNGSILYANLSSTFLLHYWNCNVGQYLPDSLCQLVSEVYRTRLLKKGIEVQYRDQTFSFTIVPVVNTDYVNLYGVDITMLKRAEEELKRNTAQLNRSNEELQNFAYITSHDLQEPLRMISSYLQLIERRYKGKLDTDADEFISYAVDGANRLQRMINGLLEYSRVGTRDKQLELTNCDIVLQKALTNFKIAIEESGAVINYDPLPIIMVDSSQFVQVFQNLIGNAIKFRGSKPPHIQVSARHEQNEWVFSLSDNGIGIDPEYSERIFGLFKRLHGNEYPGVGLGLSICQKIIERYGGRIWVESEQEKGATFYFTIPSEEKTISE